MSIIQEISSMKIFTMKIVQPLMATTIYINKQTNKYQKQKSKRRKLKNKKKVNIAY